MTALLDSCVRQAGVVPGLPYVQILGGRRDRTGYVVYSADGRERVAHVKVSTSDHGRVGLAAEYAALTRLRESPGLVGTVPSPRAWVEADGTVASVVTGMAGRPLDVLLSRRPMRSRRRVRRYAAGVVSWLDVLHAGTAHGTTAVDPDAAADTLRAAGVPRARVDEVRELLDANADVRLPRVTGHGDLWPANVLVDAAGRVAVVDWETADPDAEPYDDLLFFLLTFVRATLSRTASLTDALEAGFLGGPAWRTRLVAEQVGHTLDRDGVPCVLANPLTLLFLARRALATADRVGRRLPSSPEWPAMLARYLATEGPVSR